jgi:hypothetical protein
MSTDQIVSSLVGNILIPFAVKSTEPLASKIGEKTAGKMESLYNTIKSKFSSDPHAVRDLERFEKDPEGYKTAIEDDLKDKFKEDHSFEETILKLENDIQKDPSVTVYLENLKGDRIIGQNIENMKSGTSQTTISNSEGKEIIGYTGKSVGSD